MINSNDIRRLFLDYFARHGHQPVASSPLVPFGDPSLMFVNSGMVQFKNVFLGAEKRAYKTATTAQKCVRAGGKHNDLDNVGYTARHHSFFEMLGNFSFGDYFKEQAIFHAWQVVHQELQLPKDKLCVTVYHDDEEAAIWWKKIAGFSDDKIIRIATSDNFWQMGDTGPCGPCSEIFYDHGDTIAGGPPGSKDQDGDRFIEIWNLVFMQYEMKAGGVRMALPNPSIDTGMGLERISAVLEGVHNNYDIAMFQHIIAAMSSILGQKTTADNIASFRVIADHLRAMSFLIADGVLPANEGRGYVLRRIMRRAMRHAHLLGCNQPLFHRLLPSLIDVMGGHYQELGRARALIASTMVTEEEKFQSLLGRGIKMLDKELEKLSAGQALPGAVAFQLYDTYGFPLDLTIDVLRGLNRGVEQMGFDEAMAAQKKRARAAWAGSGEDKQAAIWFSLRDQHGASEFLGYDTMTAEGKVVALLDDTLQPAQQLAAGQAGWVITNQTPFYGEAGGQMGDRGWLERGGDKLATVQDSKKYQGVLAQRVVVADGAIIKVGDDVLSRVDEQWRRGVMANHSATHLLHAALRQYLGAHVAQKGSLVAPDYLRFDFSHMAAVDRATLTQVERTVNDKIGRGGGVRTLLMGKKEAEEMGAMALFGEKYGDEVRVVLMGQGMADGNSGGRKMADGDDRPNDFYSIELCGGTHVVDTSDIGLFMIEKEESVAAGVRRIVAVSGSDVIHGRLDQTIGEWQAKIKKLASGVEKLARGFEGDKADGAPAMVAAKRQYIDDLAAMYESLSSANKKQQQELRDKQLGSWAKVGTVAPHPRHGFVFLGEVLQGVAGKELKSIIDNIKKRPECKDAVIAILASEEDKLSLAVAVVGAAAAHHQAMDLAKLAAGIMGGSGGGRADFAQAGGTGKEKSAAVLAAIKQAVMG